MSGQFPSLSPLGAALRTAVDGRHVLLFSHRPDAERISTALGADGGVPPPDVDWGGLTIQNFSGNKLDYYVDSALRLTGRRPQGKIGEIRAEVRLSNTAPANGRPPYVFGPFNPSLRAGEYRGLVTLYVPAGTFLKSSAGADLRSPPIVAADGGQTVVTFTVTVQPGTTRAVTLDLLVPPGSPGPPSLRLVPTPRVRPTAASVDLTEGAATLRIDELLVRPMVLGPAGARPVTGGSG